MRILGITLLLGGFCWIAWETTMGFSQYQYLQWIIHTRGSPNESISRTEASKLLSEVCLALNVRQRSLIPPAFLMLMGGGICCVVNRQTMPQLNQTEKVGVPKVD